MQPRCSNQGMSVIEVLLGLALFAVIFVFISETLTIFFQNHKLVLEQTQAVYLAEAGQESLRYLRDEDWNTLNDLTLGTTYYLDVSTTTIATSTVAEVIDSKFTRSVVLWPAYRDSNNDLVASTTSGASVDTGGFISIVTVTWGSGEQVQLQSLLTNLQDI